MTKFQESYVQYEEFMKVANMDKLQERVNHRVKSMKPEERKAFNKIFESELE